MVEFRMVLPRLDVQIRPPPVEPPVPLSAAEESRRRPEPPVKRFVWTKYEDTGFPSRVNHATVACKGVDGRNYIYSIGGFHSSDEERERRLIEQPDDSPYFKTGPIDVHCMDVETRHWNQVNVIKTTKDKQIPIRGGEPPRRYGHTCLAYKNKIYMFGGRNDDDGSFRVMECFDANRSMWLKVVATAEGCSKPKSRDGHAVCNRGKDMYMHGGFDTGSLVFTGDLYVFDMETHTWRLLPDAGDEVSARDFHSAVCLSDRIVIFGGRSDLSAPHFSDRDFYDSYFYEYILDEQKWVRVDNVGYRPHGRRSLCAVHFAEDKVLYFGGYNARLKRHFNDVFIYNAKTKHITEVVPYGNVPSPRRRCGHCLVDNEFIICGGTSPIKRNIRGKETLILHDHDDVYVLNFLPKLEQLCMMVVKELHLSTAGLPIHIRQKLSTF